MNPKYSVSVGAVLALVAGPVSAEISIDGFGQVVVGSTLGNNPAHQFPGYTDPTGTDPTNSHYGADPSFKPESLFALQVRAPLSDRLSATAQILALGQDNNDFTPKFAWAYATYQLSNSWSVRAGRQRLPITEYADYLQAGEAYPWLRPPASIYSTSNVVNDFDGLSLYGSYGIGHWDLRPNIFYGDFSGSVSFQGQNSELSVHNIVGIALDTSYNQWLSLNAHYAVANVSSDNGAQLDQLFAALDAFGLPQVASGLDINNSTTTYAAIGFNIDRRDLFMAGECQFIKVNESFSSRIRNYYLSTGYHIGSFMPVVSFSHEDEASSNSSIVQQASPLLLEGAQGVALDQAVQLLVASQRRLDNYYQVGARYDLTRNTSLKIDFTRFLNSIPGPQNFSGTPPSANLLSAAVVFAF